MSSKSKVSSLKAFVRVSKTNEGLYTKDDSKSNVRMTRSKTAAMAAAAAATVTAAPISVPEKELNTTASSVSISTSQNAGDDAPKNASTPQAALHRKRKHAAIAPCSELTPSKRPMRTPRTVKTIKSTASRAKPISMYYSPSKSVSTKRMADLGPKSAIETAESASSSFSSSIVASMSQGISTARPSIQASKESVALRKEVGSLPGIKKALDERAGILLERLRKRAKPQSDINTKVSETREIQEELRERRYMAESNIKGSNSTPKSFVTITSTPDTAIAHELVRGFVMMNATKADPPLPREMKKLNEIFQALEHTVMFNNRTSDGVVYHRVRKAVEAMAKRTFGWKELGQILSVYPESYSFKPVSIVHAGRKVQSVSLVPVECGVVLAAEMENRRNEFKRRLFNIVAGAHTRFLVTRGYTERELEGISGWHPSFDIESVASVTPKELLPAAVVISHQSGQSAPLACFDKEKLKHLLLSKKARSNDNSTHASAHTPIELTSRSTQSDCRDTPKPPALNDEARSNTLQSGSVQKKTASDTAPKERAKSLLERIREKQRLKEAEANEGGNKSLTSAERSMYSRLPGILEAVSYLYYAEHKSTLPLFYVVDKLVESKGIGRSDGAQHIMTLARHVPQWCIIIDDAVSGNAAGGSTATNNEPSPNALLKVTRKISLNEARSQLKTSTS